jgi:hypothetical protein
MKTFMIWLMVHVPGTKAHRLQKKLNEGTWHDFAGLQNQAGDTAANTRRILKAIGATPKGQENTNTEKWSCDLPDFDNLQYGLVEPEQLTPPRVRLLYKRAVAPPPGISKHVLCSTLSNHAA